MGPFEQNLPIMHAWRAVDAGVEARLGPAEIVAVARERKDGEAGGAPRMRGTLILGRSRKFLATWMDILSRKEGEM